MKTELLYTCAAASAAFLLLGAGCKSKGEGDLVSIPKPTVVTKTVQVPGPNTPNTPDGPGDGNTGGPGDGSTGTDIGNNDNGWPKDPTQGLKGQYDWKRDVFKRVHFDYDSSELRPEDVALVQAVGQFLIANPTHLLLVEGHCDERGTEEYNTSLGERRALAVLDELVRVGVSVDRMRPESYGEKMPLVETDTKESHAMNRRGEFVLVVPRLPTAPAVNPTGTLPAERIDFAPGQ